MEILGAKWTDVLQCFIAAGGFWLVWSQIKQLRQATAGTTFASLYGEYIDVCKLFLERPHLRPYFYDSAAVSSNTARSDPIHQEIETTCELIVCFLEHVTLQRVNIPGAAWEECWKEYTNARFTESPAMRSFWKRNRIFYAMQFRAVVDERLGAAETSAR